MYSVYFFEVRLSDLRTGVTLVDGSFLIAEVVFAYSFAC